MSRHGGVRALCRIAVAAASIAPAGGVLAAPVHAGTAPKPGSDPAVGHQDPADALPPVSQPGGTGHCAVTAVDHDFGNTFGTPPVHHHAHPDVQGHHRHRSPLRALPGHRARPGRRRPAGPLPHRRRGPRGPEGLSPGIGCQCGMAGLSP
ncbi:hypothetical protein ACFVFH_01540 [Streptomyces sp. NPDC057697]|uniref:hypothetical protein n=1 Tax=Streptomyces sp. NPDC057697 TaxID=3346219 RepID=UPI0036A30066